MRAFLIVMVLLTGCPGPERIGKPAGKAAPKLVVLIVVDQLPTWAFDRDRPLFEHGFARLLRDGAFVRAGLIPYASPFTAPGHASIGTGEPPSVHGVIGNTWFRRDEGRERDAEYDAGAGLFSVGPTQGGDLAKEDGASGNLMRVPGIADALRARRPGAKSIAIGLKPRAAAFVAGQRPDLAVWYESAAGGMTTTRAYTPEVPPWLVKLAKDKPVSRFFDVTWDARDPEMLARVTGLPDDAPGEGEVHGLDTKFPHELAKSDAPARAILHTPYGDEIVFDTATAALDAMQLGADDVPDLLAVSFNSHDYAGHLWGPDSWEALDLTLRFDERLGSFFELLDQKVGKGAWAVVLTSDHGATPVVERARIKGSRRIRTKEIADVVDKAVAGILGEGLWVAAVTSSNVYMVPMFRDKPPEVQLRALAKATAALRKLSNIAAAGMVDVAECKTREGLERAICLSWYPPQSGDLYVMPVEGSLISDYKNGTHHDAPFDDNRRVPIIVMAPGLAPQTGEGSLLQVAPTVSALLGIAPPNATPLFGLR